MIFMYNINNFYYRYFLDVKIKFEIYYYQDIVFLVLRDRSLDVLCKLVYNFLFVFGKE